MKIRHFLLFVVVLMSLLGFGCAPVRSDMTYLQAGGCGEVSGQMSGMDFCAVVEIASGGERVRVEYLSPQSLCGLILTSEGDACEVCLGEMRFTCKTSDVVGFLRPVTSFLQEGEVDSVQKEGENTVLTFPTGQRLTISTKGEPLAFEGEDVSLRMVWWQSAMQENVDS